MSKVEKEQKSCGRKKKKGGEDRAFRNHFQLACAFALIVIVINILGLCLSGLVVAVLWKLGVASDLTSQKFPLIYFAMISLISGSFVAVLLSRVPLKPIRTVTNAAEEIAEGNYQVRIPEKGPKELRHLYHSFNHMAEELSSVELLRSDFVNNFSHEFKTPIVSIRGFARMLKWEEDLTKKEREEYLDIIIEESERLTALASNVLNLSRIEQQAILTEKKRCNVSEEIRRVIAMMESKWQKKKIRFQFDSGEIFLNGNEELLKEVWINLLDNAIKFSPEKGVVRIEVEELEDSIRTRICNQGSAIPEENRVHLFDKFYQGDSSHSGKGNGLGLAIVKKVVELHGGRATLAGSDEDGTVFEVILPIIEERRMQSTNQ